jgi:hypothetical protein
MTFLVIGPGIIAKIEPEQPLRRRQSTFPRIRDGIFTEVFIFVLRTHIMMRLGIIKVNFASALGFRYICVNLENASDENYFAYGR